MAFLACSAYGPASGVEPPAIMASPARAVIVAG